MEINSNEEDLTQRILACVPVGVLLIGVDLRVLHINERARNILGLPHSSLLTMESLIGRIIHEDTSPLALEDFSAHRCLRTKQPQPARVTGIQREDGVVWIEVIAEPFFEGEELQGAVVSLLDITTRKQAKDALRASEERFRNLSSIATEGIMIHEDGVVLDVNQAFVDLAGYKSPEELIGQNAFRLVTLTKESLERVQHHIQTNSADTYEVELQRPDGALVAAETRGRALLYQGRNTRLVYMRDITEQKGQQKMMAMGTLVAGVAHEVRNPLFAISATLDAFEARFGNTEGFDKYHQVLRGELARLTGFMQDLLNYGKPTSLNLSSINIEEPLQSALHSCDKQIKEKQIKVIIVNLNSDCEVKIDKNKIAQVFHNIIDNSIHFSPVGSSLHCDISLLQQREKRWLCCAIKDSGPGIREDDLQKLFIPFFSKRRGGTGLGLCIAQKFIEEHHGKLKITNHPEGGAWIQILLPAS